MSARSGRAISFSGFPSPVPFVTGMS